MTEITPQPDPLAGRPAQGNLLDLLPPPSHAPKPEKIRKRLLKLLATARGADRMPWPTQEAEVNAILFRQMANWLPEAERDALRADFAAEMERLRAAG